MKKILLASVLTVIASNAFAGGLYISPKIGWTYNKLDSFEYYYAGGDSGQERLSSGNDSNMHAGLAVGYDFHKVSGLNLRVEGEYLYHAKADIEKTDRSGSNLKFENEIHSFNANVYYDFRNSTGFTPYIGAGIGYARVDAKYSDDYFVDFAQNSEGSKDNNKFTWNIQAGLDYHFNDHNAIGLGYRFTEYGKVKADFDSYYLGPLNEEGSVKTYTHELTLSYRYTF